MKLRKNIVCIMLAIAFLIIIAPKVNAANLLISFSNSNAKVGDTITATVTGKGIKGNVNLSVTGNATLSESSIYVDGSKSITVKINGEGDVKVTATGVNMTETSAGSETQEGSETDNQTKYNGATAGTIKVASNQTKKSNNANLSSLGIKPNDFKGFKINTTTYNVTVPNDVKEVTVYGTTQDKKATVKGLEKKSLEVGKNEINVVVTAEDGTTTKTYAINVTREGLVSEANTNTQKNETTTSDENSEDVKNADLKSLSISGYTLSPAFSSDVYEYKVDVNKDVSSLDIQAVGANNNVSIDIAGNENLKEGENVITLLVYNEETKQNSTYQITANKKVEVAEVETLNEAAKKAEKIRYILLGVIVVVVIGIIIFVIVKSKINNDDEEMYEYDEDDKERLNLDDEEEFFNRVNNKKVEEAFAIKDVTNSEEDNEENTTKIKKKGKHF